MEDEVYWAGEYGEWLRASPATQQGRRHDGPAPAGRSRAEESNSASGDSSTENQGRDSRVENSNSNSRQLRKEDISVTIDKTKDSAHEEMLTEAFLAERSMEFNPHPNPEPKGNHLTPFMEQVLKKISRPIPTPLAQSTLAQPISQTALPIIPPGPNTLFETNPKIPLA